MVCFDRDEYDVDYYDDWFSDNKEDLIEDFIDNHYEQFKKYCNDEFENHLASSKEVKQFG